MIRKNLLSIFLLLISVVAIAQNAEKEINEQVWKPFTQAIMTQDMESFITLHSKDVMRVERDHKQVLNYDTYKSDLAKSWPAWKQSIAVEKTKYTFELRFLERISKGDQAFEVGYFKNEMVNTKGEKHISYGQFHVALRKESSVWKILVDSDSKNNRSITEEMFQAAKPME
jgi:ketosteroid isomerase-like protein